MSIELKAIAALVFVIALVTGYFSWERHERDVGAAPYITKLADLNGRLKAQKDEAVRELAAETAKTKAAQATLDLTHFQQEKTDELNKQNTDGLVVRLHDLAARSRGRLRDPGARRGGSRGSAQSTSAASSDDRAADAPQDRGLLSKQLTDFLLAHAAAADAINDAYISCRADAFAVRANQN